MQYNLEDFVIVRKKIILPKSGVSDEYQGSRRTERTIPPKSRFHRQFSSEVQIFTAKWPKSKLDTAKYSTFGGEHRRDLATLAKMNIEFST